ncbi:XopAJ/AvrRxo1 family type III secretion system effector zeta toxin [Corallococcus sp. CA047B]|uniref:XopAJ/AvrRxo1 family type III secretion system effector zeta toxin n=1 Tax=Corallococcus sp. CA047B TaxID=2316729 RepID=UPI0011C441EE|nr:XopAJ/AvrRxo1 family type III secretion system effector zeta toxin [Corallococcus sp. CA047B]
MGIDGTGNNRPREPLTARRPTVAPPPEAPPAPANVAPKPAANAVPSNAQSTFDRTTPREGPQLAPPASSLLTENARDAQANCLDKAADWVDKATPALRARSELVFLKDTRPGQEGQSGHVVVRQGERVVDPSSGKSYDNLQAFLKDQPQYRQSGTLSANSAHKIFSAAPGSAERQKAITDAKVAPELQRMMVADSPPGTTTASAPQKPATPPYTAEQASKDATALYEATDGGVFGAGTDEDKIFQTLEGKTPEQINLIRQSYKDHYNKDLDAKLEDELGGDDWKRAQALLSADAPKNDAVVIQSELDGVFGSSEEVLKTLEKRSPDERKAIAQKFAELNGGAPAGQSAEDFMLSKLGKELDTDEMSRARSLLGASQAQTPQQKLELETQALKDGLKRDMDGLGTDEDRIFERLEKATPEQRALLAQDPAVASRLKDELGGEDYDRAMGLLQGNPGQADAARIRESMSGWTGADEKGVRKVLEGKTPDQLTAIKAEYEKQTGKSLESEIRGWGGADADVTLRLLNPPAPGDKKAQAEAAAEKLQLAMDGAGTDEEAIRQTLEGKSKPELDDIAAAYKQKYGKDLRAELDSELDGRDQLELLNQNYDLGAVDPNDPNAAQERVRRLREQQANESGFGTWVLDGVQRTFKGESDNDRINRDLTRADTAIKSGDTQRANTLTGYAADDVKSLQTSKDSLADGAASAAVVVVTTAAVIGTGGAATPLAIAGYAALGAATRVGTYAALQGDAAGGQELLRQAGIGAVEGGTAVLPVGKGAGAVTAGARTGATTAAKEVATTAVRETVETSVKAAVVQGAKEGAVGGAAGGAFDAATRSETWENGVGDGLVQVGKRAVIDGTVGAVTGGVVGAGTAKAGQLFREVRGKGGALQTDGPNIRFTTSEGRVFEGTVTPENAKDVLKIVKAADLRTGKTTGSYEVRQAILERSGGKVGTFEAFTVGEPPKDGSLWKWLEEPKNWVPERREFQQKLLNTELDKAQTLSDRLEPNTVYALRGNTAAGKTTAVKNDPHLKSKVLDDQGELSGALNPDPIKAQIAEQHGGKISTSQAHVEGSIISQRVENEMLSRPNSSVVYDKRFAGESDIPRMLKAVEGRNVKIVDLEVPLETSSVRVLMRNPGTADPLVPFDAVEGGFKGVRQNRAELLAGRPGEFKGVIENEKITDYKLLVTDSSGKQVLVAEKRGGTWFGPDTPEKQALFNKAVTENPAAEADRVKNTIIDDAFIDRQVGGITNPDFAQKMRARLTEYKGKTLGEALEQHSKKTA